MKEDLEYGAKKLLSAHFNHLENTPLVYFYKLAETRICHLRTPVKIRANTKIDPSNAVQCINRAEEEKKY